jgi:hypothetical protein
LQGVLVLFNAMRSLENFGDEVEILAWGGKCSETPQSNMMHINQFVGPGSDDAMVED